MNPGTQSCIDCYKSISSPSKGIYKDKGSKFLAFAFPVETEEQAKAAVASLKKEYFDARHHCWAYRLGATGEKWRANDDGEPSSTAGKPIYGQILSNELSDIVIVVVRYFGGILLGTSGLIVAYKAAAADAIANAQIVEKIATARYRVEFDYLQMNAVMKCLKDFQLTPQNTVYDNGCSLEVNVRLTQEASFLESMNKICICQKA
ncbi:MAG: YigZ family protein [Bacteroidales bacterium]|nr:YigZ family protein [Bacteroidales bacterium]